MATLDDRTTITATDVFLIGFKLSGHVLVTIAGAFEWILKFILYFLLYSINVLEAVISVVVQILKMFKKFIRVLFKFGGFFYRIAGEIGAQGSFVLILCLFTYLCFWRDSEIANILSSITSVKTIQIVCIAAWILVAPAMIVFAIITTKRKFTKLVSDLILENAFLKTRSRSSPLYVDKSTSTHLELSQGSTSDSSEKIDSGTPTDFSGDELEGRQPIQRRKKKGRRMYSGPEKERQRKSSGKEEKEHSKGRRKRKTKM